MLVMGSHKGAQVNVNDNKDKLCNQILGFFSFLSFIFIKFHDFTVEPLNEMAWEYIAIRVQVKTKTTLRGRSLTSIRWFYRGLNVFCLSLGKITEDSVRV